MTTTNACLQHKPLYRNMYTTTRIKNRKKQTNIQNCQNYSINASDENGITEIVNWACKTNLTPPLFIKVQIPSQDLGF